MVSFVRDDIIDGDFACCMENLQKSSSKVPDVRKLLKKANFICDEFNNHQEENYGESDSAAWVYSELIMNDHV